MALVPVFMVFYYLGEGGDPAFRAAALAVFVIASATDAVDGHIARRNGMITNFGKLMDPLADKVLTAAAFICFVDSGLTPAWVVVVILAREFLITGLRGVAASEGVVIAAGAFGKLKTVLQMGTIALFLLSGVIGAYMPAAPVASAALTAAEICLWATLVVTVYSGVEYMWKCRKLLNTK
jgi:CDP-diacylglycerol--glycerol-3-phosphate 3-phosphatidyltransferase